MRHTVSRLWLHEGGLTVLLASLVLIVFVLRPLVDLGMAGARLIELALASVLLSGVWTIWGGKLRMVLVGLGICLAELLRGLYWSGTAVWLAPWAMLGSAIMIGLLLMLVLTRVFSPGPVTRQRIEGAVAAYLLFGLAWAQLYEAVEVLAPGAFGLPKGEIPVGGWFSPLLYFSFVTLTTVGYGDIQPVHPVVRSLAMFEALVGQLYPAVLIGRLVSLRVTADQQNDEEGLA
jgi:hypothetical protein